MKSCLAPRVLPAVKASHTGVLTKTKRPGQARKGPAALFRVIKAWRQKEGPSYTPNDDPIGMFRIHTEDMELRLEIVSVASLVQHEEVLPETVEKLAADFRKEAVLRNPIIIDENNVVVDGNHRAFVFRKFGFTYIAVCRIEYFCEANELRYWFRLLKNIKNPGILKQLITELKGEIRWKNDKEALREALREDPLCWGLQQGNRLASVHFPAGMVYDAVSAYAVLGTIQDKLIQNGIKVGYVPCQTVTDTDFCEGLGQDEMVIWTPQITKEMVVDAVKKNKLFSPKATRHCIRARPLHIDVPLAWLKEEINIRDIDERFTEFLRAKRLRRFPPGQVIDGRYYEEELFVFTEEETVNPPEKTAS